jgi:predicted O-methyltransferase YrrM
MNPNFMRSSWFNDHFRGMLAERSTTQQTALGILNQFTHAPTILETGTIRRLNDWGAGLSTLLFGWYVKEFGGRVITVDCDAANIQTCKEATHQFANYITYVTSDSCKYLADFEGKIDLLYLDSMDTPIEGDASKSQQHNLNEFILAERSLADRAVIVIDDVGLPNGGKAAKTHEYLIAKGYLWISNQQQSVWLKI